MTAPTVTMSHITATADDNGIALLSIAAPAGMKWFGGWAESCAEASAYGADDHYSCTPTTPTSHSYGTTGHPVVQTYCEYSSGTDTTYVYFGFKCDPGLMVRAHVFTVS